MASISFILLFAAALFGYFLNRKAASDIRLGRSEIHSLPGFHGGYSALLVLVPGLVFLTLWLVFQGIVIDRMVMVNLPAGVLDGLDGGQVQLIEAEIKSLSRDQVFKEPEPWKVAAAAELKSLQSRSSWIMISILGAIVLGAIAVARGRVSAEFRARQGFEGIVHWLMVACSVVAVLTTVGIFLSLIYESILFFRKVPFTEFFFGLNWEPQIPMREDQIAGAGAFGWIPVMLGTLVITTVALVIAIPVGLFSAIYLNEFASPQFRSVVKPVLEVLAGVPTVIYGFFAILVVAPALRSAGANLGLDISPNTALAAGSVMAVMLVPFISSFADDALAAVPQALRDGSLALGATRAETMIQVLFPAAIPGIVGGILLAVSRAIGETMIVVMAAGLIAKLTINPLESVTTVTVQIVTLLIGDTSFDSPKTLAAFALGLMLFLVTLAINLFALRFVRKYREVYD